MSRYTNGKTFNFIVPLGSIEASMDLLLKKISQAGANVLSQKLIPSFIRIEIPEDLSNDEVHQVRLFLKGLRKVHTKYFLRFVTNLLWAAESDNTDIFYTRSNNADCHVDAVLSLKVLDRKSILIHTVVPKTTAKHRVLKQISKTMIKEIDTGCGDDPVDILQTITRFHHKENLNEVIQTLGEDDFHMFFIPSIDEWNLYPIALYGLSQTDAYHRYLAAENQLELLTISHQMVVPDKLYDHEIVMALIETLQDQEVDGNHYRTAKAVYAIAELLFGYYLAHMTDNNEVLSSNESLCFEIIEDEYEENHFEIYNVKVASISP